MLPREAQLSIYSYQTKAGERWRFLLDLPGPERHQLHRRGFLTAEEARTAEAAAARAHGAAERLADGTLGAALVQWAEDCEINLALTSARWYQSIVRRYLVPALGQIPLVDVPRAGREVNRTYKQLRNRGLSTSSVRSVHKTLSAALGAMGVDMPADVRVPAAKKSTGRRGTWTAVEAAKFLAFVAQDRLYPAWALALVCGLRRGELAGVRWRWVDLDAGLLLVRKQRVVLNGGGVVDEDPKGASERDIPLGNAMIALLREWQATWDRMRAEAGDRWRGEDRVFVWDRGRSRGRPYHPSYFTHRFPELCDAAGVPRIALHDARHSSATISAGAGVGIKVLQARMGHSDAKILTGIYLHLVGAAERAGADVIEGALLPPAA